MITKIRRYGKYRDSWLRKRSRHQLASPRRSADRSFDNRLSRSRLRHRPDRGPRVPESRWDLKQAEPNLEVALASAMPGVYVPSAGDLVICLTGPDAAAVQPKLNGEETDEGIPAAPEGDSGEATGEDAGARSPRDEADGTGPIPLELADLRNLVSLVLSSNRLTGPVPGNSETSRSSKI